MKYFDEYRDGAVAKAISEKIKAVSSTPAQLMEICGTHTMAIFKHGVRSLLPDHIDLISGPGCPVCVTSMEEVDRGVKLAKIPGVIVTTFGDLIRVPGSGSTLQEEKAKGADVRVVYSTFEALKCAKENPDQHVVFMGIGFETTAPTIAAAIQTAFQEGIENFSVLSAHKLLPPAMEALLSGGDLKVQGFMCPGHVTTIIGTHSYEEVVSRYHIPCVVTGFEPIDILQGVLMLVEQFELKQAKVEIQYTRGASPEGNPGALKIMHEVFEPCDTPWRGLGVIPASGLAVREAYSDFDARKRFDVEVPPAIEPPGCLCARILRGDAKPIDCKLFRKSCSPSNPIGACMVSSEGTCAAYFKYHDS
jgi:hydrogenase expression/formation protein HypD